MGLLDVLNGMQNGPHGPSHPSTQSNGGMSPIGLTPMMKLPIPFEPGVRRKGSGQLIRSP